MGDVAEATVQQAEAEVHKAAEIRERSEEEFKKLIAERDKAKERLRLIDEAAKKTEEEKRIAEGKARELLAEKEAKLVELEAKAKQYEEQQGKLRESLLGKLTDEADKIAGENIHDLDKLARYVELRSQNSGGPFSGKGAATVEKRPPLKLNVGSLGDKSEMESVRQRLRAEGFPG